MLPSISALGLSAASTAATRSPFIGYATYMGLTNPMVASAEYQEAYDYIYNK